MSQRVDKALREQVIARAKRCCKYYGLPDDVVLVKHQPDHVVATRHGGQTALENLAYA
jgi:5-methylcytosine-specific restriction endonuclease McrA